MKFIDEVEVIVGSGNGGPGAVSFRREAMTPRGGPDGGDGGRGGNIIFRVHPGLNSLVDYRANRKYLAPNGQPGAGANCSGAAGQDLILNLPEGTLVKSETGEVLVDMTGIQEHLFLKGGRGGKGNWFFKTSVNQAPEHAQPGESGEVRHLRFELKLIADVGIIGFPNAGKSTLISRVSSARPKIADYPFTTLTPNLGVVKVGEYRSFVVADIPGLIRGAHQGVGLGIQFLKHIERTKIFLHLVDVSGMTGVDPVQAYEDIQHELKMYDQTNQDKPGFFPLSNRQQLVILNKVDTRTIEDVEKIQLEFQKKLGVKTYLISGVTGQGVSALVFDLAKIVLPAEED